jgi:hypothetical protein
MLESNEYRQLPPCRRTDPSSSEEEKSTPEKSQEAEIPGCHPVYLTGFKLYAIIASITLVFFLVILDMSIIATAVPKITSDFHSLEDVGWYGSVYQLARCGFPPPLPCAAVS